MTFNSLTTTRSNWNLEMLVFVEGGNPENPEKNPRSKDENQQQTQPTYDVESGNRTRATLVGGQCSHHCAIPAPCRFILHFTYFPSTRQIPLTCGCYTEFAQKPFSFWRPWVLAQLCLKPRPPAKHSGVLLGSLSASPSGPLIFPNSGW